MNIFARITARTMKENKTRTIVTIIGVILSTAMITAVATLGGTFQNFFIEYTKEQDGSWHVAGLSLPVKEAEKAEKQAEVVNSTKVAELGYARYEHLLSPMMPYLYVQSFSENTRSMLPVALKEGKFPEKQNEVIIPDYLNANLEEGNQILIGDTLPLELGEREYKGERLSQINSYMGTETKAEESFVPKEKREFTVVGIYDYSSLVTSVGAPGYEVYAGPGNETGSYTDIYVELKDIKKTYDFQKEVFGGYGSVTHESLLQWYGVMDNDRFSTVYTGLLLILTAVIMTGSVLLIYNAFSISLRERSTQFGLLSSLGATKKQLRQSMRYEAFMVSLIGIPLGVLSGIAGIGITLHFIEEGLSQWLYGESKEIPLVVNAGAVLLSVMIAFFTVFISVWIPSKRIKRLSPMEAIRASEDIKIRPGEVKTGGWVFKIFGLPGMMADKNYKRDRKKYRTTIVSLSISILLFTTAALFQIYLIETGSFVMDVPAADVECVLYEPDKDGEKTDKILEKTEGIEEIFSYEKLYLMMQVPSEILGSVFEGREVMTDENYTVISAETVILPNEVFEEMAKKEGISLSAYKNTEVPRFLYTENEHTYNSSTQRYETQEYFLENGEKKAELGWITTSGKAEKEIFEPQGEIILGDAVEKLPEKMGIRNTDFTLFMSESMYQDFSEYFLRTDPIKTYNIKCENPGVVSETLEKELKEQGIQSENVTDLHALYQQDRNTMMAVQILTYGFIILISLIAVANVFNTISTNFMLRRKEFAMLRSMGMSPKGFNRMLYYECLIYGSKSVLYGIILTVMVSYVICKVIGIGADAGFVIPWGDLITAIAGVFLVVFASMIYAMCRIRKNNIVEELKMM
ncbi:outer membrane-specific lipoprotein transporter subunit LolE [uncultured Blautia sp.]